MLKSEAIKRWGSEAVELARDYYETDFDKYLFDEDSPNGFGACEEDQIERCTRAYRNMMLDGPVDSAMGREEPQNLNTRRTVSHEYVYQMPVAAYRSKRKNLSQAELDFLGGNPGWEYAEHWSTPGRGAQRLFAEPDVNYMLENLTYALISARETAISDEVAKGIQIALDKVINIRS